MKEAAVIGKPVSHSRSPAIFSFLARQRGLADFRYSAIEVLPGGLTRFLTDLRRKPSFVGLNVTIPHKESILAKLDELTPGARAVGAANVVEALSGKLKGHNTDVIGVSRTLSEQGYEALGRNAFIYGAGGAARAAAYALGEMGAAQIYLFNRSPERAHQIASDLEVVFPKTRFIARGTGAPVEPLSLVINSTPIGMLGASQEGSFFSDLARLPLERGAIAFDLVYIPERTIFLSQAEAVGLRPVGGLDMLIYQALASWEIWFGQLGSDEMGALKQGLASHLRVILKGKLLKEAAPARNKDQAIFLAGFMGAGKSAVGAALAKKLGWSFLDTDQMIVEEAGMSIPELFSTQGEARFRELERAAVRRVAAATKTVVSLGGGTLMSTESFQELRESGHLVFLSASRDSLLERLAPSSDRRPLLTGLDPQARREKVESLLQARLPVYEQAQYRIETDGLRIDEVVEAIQRRIFGSRR